MKTKTTLLALAFALLAGPGRAQVSFGTYVALGDSLTAGFMSNSLVTTHQVQSYPALIARQAGIAGFEQPLISEPGIPAELALVSLVPQAVIAPKSASTGTPTNSGLGRPYNNLGVPGATAIDCLQGTTGTFQTIVLRGQGSQVQQALALRPTLVTLWIGNNDVLGAVIAGQAIDGVTLTPAATFRVVYNQILTALRGAGVPVLAANLPDPLTIPFVTTIPPVVANPANRQPILVNGQTVPLLGPTGPLPPGSLVTLGASSFLVQGIGIPAALGGTGQPLPDEVILDPAEIATIRDRWMQDNQAIAELGQAAGATVVDMAAVLRPYAAGGVDLGGVTISSAFLTGGLFSYDGVHPTELGYALVANEWIRAINARGASLAPVNLGPFLFGSTAPRNAASAASPRASALGAALEFSREAFEELRAVFALRPLP